MRLRSRTLPFALAVLFLLPSLLFSQSAAGKIDALMQKYAEYRQFNGALLVAEHGNVILKKGYGLANFEWDIPNTADTKFRLGSITKQFTAMLIMRQVERGKIGLDDPVVKYLPDYPRPQGEKVNVRHLLTHTSGIPNYTEFMDIRFDRRAYSLDQLVATFSVKPLEFEPGSHWKYSNSGYVLLGAILEKATGKTYEQLLHQEILGPLGMTSTGYDHFESILKKRAAGYERPVDLVNAPFLDMSVPFAAGAMYSSVEDLFLWDRALYGEKLLSEEGKKVYFTPFRKDYAFGWLVQKLPAGNSTDSVLTINHGGGINGFNTLIVRLPESQDLIVLLNNTGGTNLEEMAVAMIGILFDKPYAQPRQSLAEVLGATIAEKEITGALALYQDLKGKTSEYYLSEAEMNRLGYRLLGGGGVKDAIAVFSLNVEAFPKSWNVYDSLGEAYMNDGQTSLAIKNYEKSIELNPNNANGVEVLKKLHGAQ